jgi:pyruvate formate lyase activating enzyme
MQQIPGQRKGSGLIFNIQRFSIHDGPGIRTTVFMKGCPLRCYWCANPESQDFLPNLMIRGLKCSACGQCVDACPQRAITVAEQSRRIDWEQCDQCLLCVESCLYQSLNTSGTWMTLDEVSTEVLRDKAFYRNSGGGVTVSGGEPLNQSEFTAALLEFCRREGIHTALDTTGFAPWDVFSQVLQHTDLVLFDLKHPDAAEHKQATGVDNSLILANLKKAAASCPVWLRIPLIAGFNDSPLLFKRIAALAREAGVEKVSLLPYHEGGRAKAIQLGKPLPPPAAPPCKERIEKLKIIVENAGIKVSVGS